MFNKKQIYNCFGTNEHCSADNYNKPEDPMRVTEWETKSIIENDEYPIATEANLKEVKLQFENKSLFPWWPWPYKMGRILLNLS